MTFALVTGAAKRIGKEIALHLASKGYDIVLHYNSSEKEAHETANQIKSFGVSVELFRADLSCTEDLEKLISFCRKFPVSVLINNASVFENDSILSEDIAESLNKHLQVNLISKASLIQSIAKSVLLNHKDKLDIINLLDYGVVKAPHNFFSYHLTNKILHSFTQLGAKQLIPNVKLNSIALGQTLKNDRQSDDAFDEARQSTPLRVSSTIKELLMALDFILGVESLTGQVIFLDGGMHLSDNRYK
jgi:NAD(P)-dependent dehydrogenase (short-subunit alcohol dehydrogenase family)